jgi:ATP-dependent RNA helicase DDX52/ROK1
LNSIKIKIFIIKIINCIEGRTGRAGRRGEAITFFTENDSENLRSIANVMRQSGCDIPQFMLEINKKLVIFSNFFILEIISHSFNSMFIHRKEKYKKRKRFDTKNSNETEKRSKKFKRSKNSENNESNETQEQ